MNTRAEKTSKRYQGPPHRIQYAQHRQRSFTGERHNILSVKHAGRRAGDSHKTTSKARQNFTRAILHLIQDTCVARFFTNTHACPQSVSRSIAEGVLSVGIAVPESPVKANDPRGFCQPPQGLLPPSCCRKIKMAHPAASDPQKLIDVHDVERGCMCWGGGGSRSPAGHPLLVSTVTLLAQPPQKSAQHKARLESSVINCI